MENRKTNVTQVGENAKINELENSVVSSDLELEIVNFYENILKIKLEKIKDDDWRNDEKLGTQDKIEVEKKFYIDVLNSVKKAIKENPEKKIIALFDLDETLVHNDWKEDNTLVTTIRPTAVSLLNSINEGGANCGFLTNRTELKNQLDGILRQLKPFINESYLFSSRGVSNNSDEVEIREKLPENLKYSFSSGDFEKILLLNSLINKKENEDKIFIPIDDFQYPVLYKYGVALKDNEKFFI